MLWRITTTASSAGETVAFCFVPISFVLSEWTIRGSLYVEVSRSWMQWRESRIYCPYKWVIYFVQKVGSWVPWTNSTTSWKTLVFLLNITITCMIYTFTLKYYIYTLNFFYNSFLFLFFYHFINLTLSLFISFFHPHIKNGVARWWFFLYFYMFGTGINDLFSIIINFLIRSSFLLQ